MVLVVVVVVITVTRLTIHPCNQVGVHVAVGGCDVAMAVVQRGAFCLVNDKNVHVCSGG